VIVIDIANGTQTAVTTDFGTFIETTPRWSPDGTQIFFAAAQATTPKSRRPISRVFQQPQWQLPDLHSKFGRQQRMAVDQRRRRFLCWRMAIVNVTVEMRYNIES
jgi:Tol biopolymer transport system component